MAKKAQSSTPPVITSIKGIPFDSLNEFVQKLAKGGFVEVYKEETTDDENAQKALKDKLANGSPEQQSALKAVTKCKNKSFVEWYLRAHQKTLEELIKMTNGLPWGPGMKNYVAEQNARMIYHYILEQEED